MKSDIDALMKEKGIDAILITGSTNHNPAMVYFTGIRNITHADYIRTKNGESTLFHSMIEREEAKSTGLPTKSYMAYSWQRLLEESNCDEILAYALRYKAMLAELNITSGRIALYGNTEFGYAYSVINMLRELIPELEIIPSESTDLMKELMFTKSPEEIRCIQKMGQVTVEVVSEIAEFLISQRTINEFIVNGKGEPITIGDIKRRINLLLAERDAESSQGLIFSIGKDAGIPHNCGNNSDMIKMGETIIFDIFPNAIGGGYFFDFTRTWCLGHANDEILKTYEDVLDVYQKIINMLNIDMAFKDLHSIACNIFKQKGHETIQHNPNAEEGYIHSLGHGIGLKIHERPFSGVNTSEQDILLPGVVFTIEPGLYYPLSGYGIRLENTIVCNQAGEFEIIADYPMDLILPIKS